MILKSSLLSCDIEATGLKSVTILSNGKTVLSNGQLFVTAVNGVGVPQPVSPSLSGTIAVQTIPSKGLKASYFHDVEGSQILINVQLQNTSANDITGFKFQMPVFSFATPPSRDAGTSNDQSAGSGYVLPNWSEFAYPGLAHPHGGMFSFDANYGTCLHVSSHLLKSYVLDNNQLYFPDTIAAGTTLTVKICINVVTNTTPASLFGAYVADSTKTIGLSPIPKENRVCFQSYAATDPSIVSSSDPFGFPTAWRLDTPDGVQNYINVFKSTIVDGVCKSQGCFFVDPEGVTQDQVRPEMLDILPPSVTAYFIKGFVPWCTANKFGFGVGTRLNVIVVPQTNITDETWPIGPEDFPYILQRWKNAMAIGMTGPVYLDSLGLTAQDAALLAYLRANIGYGMQTYTEAWTALSIRYSGVYRQLGAVDGSGGGYSPIDWEVARLLQPNLNIICLNMVSKLSITDFIAVCAKLGYVPLFDAYSAPQIIPLMP